MEKEKNEPKKIILSILGVAILVIAVIGVSFAVFNFTGIGSKQNSVTTGTLVMTYTENTNGISITNAMPMTDTAGKVLTNSNEKFEFTVSASITGTAVISYEVTAIKDASSTLLDSEVRLYLEKNGSEVLAPKNFTPIASATTVGSPAGSMLLDSGTFTTSGTNNYVLRMWVAEDTVITDVAKTYTVRINVYGKDTAGVEEVQYTAEEYFEFDSATGTIEWYNGTDKDVVIPKTINGVEVKAIGDYAFEWRNITSVIIPNSVTSIGEWAFSINQLTSVTIPNSVTSIEEGTFQSNQLTSVTISNNATSIGEGAFAGNQLTSVTIPNSVTSIGAYAFGDNQLTSVVIPNSVTSMGKCAFINNQLPDSQAFIYARNSDGTINNTILNSYGGANRNNVIIPSTVASIGEQAFSVAFITSVVIPNSVTSIGDYAFNSNRLTSITIPNSVTSIGDYAFSNNNLTSITIPNSVTSIGNSAFYYNQLTSVEIPNSVTSIGSNAFYNNYILQGDAKIDNTSGAVTIGSNAFASNGANRNITITPTYLR